MRLWKRRKLRYHPLVRLAGRLGRFLLKSQILTIFFGLCLLGLFVGATTRPAPGTFPYAELFDQLRVVSYRESPSDTSARFVVQLGAGGRVFSQYDIAARTFLPPPRGRPYARTITGTTYGSLRVRGHVGYGFWLDVPDGSRRALLPEQFDELYRTTLGFMKPVSQLTGVLGILSGYSVGYRIGSWNSSLGSRRVQERVLATPDLGRMIAREAWRRVLLEPVVMTGEDDATRFTAVIGTQRLYSNFFRVALADSDGFVPREVARLAQLGRTQESRAMRAYAEAVRRAARDTVHLDNADFEAVERWASLLDRRGHWVNDAIPPAGEERIKLLGTLAWYGLAPPGRNLDRVWVGPRMLVRIGDAEGFVADEIPGTGVGCPISWRAHLREDHSGASAMVAAWFADRPEFVGLAVFGRRVAGGIAAANRQLAAWRTRDKAAPAPPAAGRRLSSTASLASQASAVVPEPDHPAGSHDYALPFPSMSGAAGIVIVATDSSAALPAARAAEAVVARVDSLIGSGSGEVERLNREAGAGPARAHPEVAQVLARALRAWRESDHAYDLTSEPLERAWGLGGGPRRVPGPEELDAARARVGAQHVVFDSAAGTVRFEHPGVRINLAAIAPGHAVDAIVDTLVARGIRGARIELPGVVAALGAPADGGRWSVAIADPRRRIPSVAKLRLASGEALATSGRYDPYVMADGGTFGPVVDPRSGRPAEGLIGVAVLASDATTAAAWSKALLALGPREAKIRARQRPDLAVVLMEPGADGRDVIWVESDLKDRFGLERHAQTLFRVESF